MPVNKGRKWVSKKINRRDMEKERHKLFKTVETNIRTKPIKAVKAGGRWSSCWPSSDVAAERSFISELTSQLKVMKPQ